MKIGILSMHRVVNYGSFLQAYALKKIIQNLVDCEIEFIDIKKGKSLYRNNKLKKISRLIKYIFTGELVNKLYYKEFNNKLENQFKNNFYSLLGKIVSPDNEEKFDLVVIGSDEVFHCCQNTSWGFTTQLYGNISNAKKIISYAGSFGATKIEDIYKFSLRKQISDSLRNLYSISVRDENSKTIVEKLTGRTPELHLDPVLIYGYKAELKQFPEFKCTEKFLLVYSYNGRIIDKKEINAIKEFARNRNLKIYTVFCKYKWADKSIMPDTPFDVLKVFDKAVYVVSDTFHGTIFSIITHRKFCTLVRDTSVNKMTTLLKMVGLQNHIVKNCKELDSILMNDIDYDLVEKKLDIERENTNEYFKKNLKGQ